MKTMVINAGNASEKSEKSIFTTELIMNKPTMIRAGAVAAAGMIKNKGAKKIDNANIQATLTAVSPVRPPEATPEALST